jgi:hypothetical protein
MNLTFPLNTGSLVQVVQRLSPSDRLLTFPPNTGSLVQVVQRLSPHVLLIVAEIPKPVKEMNILQFIKFYDKLSSYLLLIIDILYKVLEIHVSYKALEIFYKALD